MVACKPITGSGLQHLLAHVAFLEQALEQLQQEIEQRLLPFQEEIRLLMSIPGIAELSAAGILAEIGTDMSRFPSAKHLASWAGVCPGNKQSGGKRREREDGERQRDPAGSASFSRLGHFPYHRQVSFCSVPPTGSAHWEEQSGNGCRSQRARHYLPGLTHRGAL